MTALITPFDSKGDVDEDAIAGLVRFQITKGAEGLYVCGTTGLGPLLKLDERKKVAEAVVAEVSGRVPVALQVGSADTASTVELARHAERVGADAVASLTPYYYKPGERAIFKHFERIARAVSVPLFAYNIPQFTGNNLTPSVVARLANEGTIVGVKESSRDFLQLLDTLGRVPEEFIVMNGTEEYALFALMMGAAGIVSGGANAFPELFKTLVAAHRAGDYGTALSAQETILKVKEATSTGSIASYYKVLRERGVECGRPRAPLLPASTAASRRMMGELRKLKLL